MAQPLIAVVDDDRAFLEVIQDLLDGAGYRVAVWPTAEGAFELLKREPPALLIVDRRMERIDAGVDVLQAVRLDAALRDMPVIVCTADVPWLEANAALLRAKGYYLLAKPFALKDLLALVGSLIGPGQPI